jgi:hypothetical protein
MGCGGEHGTQRACYQGWFSLDGAQAERHNEPGGTVETGADEGAAVGEFCGVLTGRLQIGSEAENFIRGSDAARQVAADDTGEILADAQAQQAILGELLAGETMSGVVSRILCGSVKDFV